VINAPADQVEVEARVALTGRQHQRLASHARHDGQPFEVRFEERPALASEPGATTSPGDGGPCGAYSHSNVIVGDRVIRLTERLHRLDETFLAHR